MGIIIVTANNKVFNRIVVSGLLPCFLLLIEDYFLMLLRIGRGKHLFLLCPFRLFFTFFNDGRGLEFKSSPSQSISWMESHKRQNKIFS